MLGLEGYGSDSEDESEVVQEQQTKRESRLASKLSPPSKSSSFSLPPPKYAIANSSRPSAKSGPSKTKKALKKITIGLPALPAEDEELKEVDDRPPPAKKARLTGAGASSLLFMLPAPKQKMPPAPERVLGGGQGPGLVFHASRPTVVPLSVPDGDDEIDGVSTPRPESAPASIDNGISSTSLLPPSLAKGKANISLEDTNAHSKPRLSKISAAPAVDLFSLGLSASSSKRPHTPTEPSVRTLSSAPAVEDFIPPEPTANDPYPGYYLLPSGSWAAYDPKYYQKFYVKWKKEYDDHVRALEKGTAKGFEESANDGTQEVDMVNEMEKARKEIQEREARKAITKTSDEEPAMPRMNVQGAKLGGRARSRHQLTTLLTEAYMNREALEERIAEGRRNRKEAGNKYGF